MLYYCCPDFTPKSAGTRLLYRHVEILNRHGIEAAILHSKPGFHLPDMPTVPVRHLLVSGTLHQGDTVVTTESSPMVMDFLKGMPLQLFAIALNWKYVYESLVRFQVEWDWRYCNIRAVLTNSPVIGEFVHWAMGLPVHLFAVGVNPMFTKDGGGKLTEARATNPCPPAGTGRTPTCHGTRCKV